MIQLIIPPLIVVFSFTALIIFIARKIAKIDGDQIKKQQKKHSRFSVNKYHNKKRKGENSYQKRVQGIRHGVGEKIVSLRKKSIVSDRIEQSDGKNPEEIKLMTAIENDPHNDECYEKLGDYYMEQESFEEARECYKYVLRLNPRHQRAQIAMKNLDRVL